MGNQSYCILSIEDNKFVQMMDEKSNKFKLVEESEATLFFSINDADNINDMLNDTQAGCFVVIENNSVKNK